MLKEIKIKVTHQQNNIMKEYALAFEIAVAKAAKGLDKIKIAQQIMDIDIIKTELPLCLIDKAIKVHKDIGRCSYNSFQLEKPCFEILDRSIKIPYIGWIDVGTEIESDSITFLSIGNNIWSLRYVPITQKVEVQYV